MPSQSKIPIYAISLLAATFAHAAPCDIYAQGNTPCVAAHSTTRALYDQYGDALYEVRRGSDDRMTKIYPRSASGVANADAQDDFCSHTTCVITTIYDQSGHGNHLTKAPGGQQPAQHNGFDWESGATGAPVSLNGQKAYGVFIPIGGGYRKTAANGVATGDAPEGMYWVVDGTHWNRDCCFDYGNAELGIEDPPHGSGHMEALYFGATGRYDGTGPWVLAEFENGLFMTRTSDERGPGTDIHHRFVTGTLKGEQNHWTLRTGDATNSSLNTVYDGERPYPQHDGIYDPMQKEGSIVLGVGGDNSNFGEGTFYEGVMTSGFPSDNSENQVQADIARQHYSVTDMNNGPRIIVGSTVSFRATTSCCTNRYIARDPSSDQVRIDFANDNGQKQRARWIVRQGFANPGCYSFESAEQPGNFIRHSSSSLKVNRYEDNRFFAADATFCSTQGFNGQGSSIRSYNYPTRYWRHFGAQLHIAANGERQGGKWEFDNKFSFTDDASFVVSGDPAFF